MAEPRKEQLQDIEGLTELLKHLKVQDSEIIPRCFPRDNIGALAIHGLIKPGDEIWFDFCGERYVGKVSTLNDFVVLQYDTPSGKTITSGRSAKDFLMKVCAFWPGWQAYIL